MVDVLLLLGTGTSLSTDLDSGFVLFSETNAELMDDSSLSR